MGGMKIGKRILFSACSLIWGFVSLDYLYYAFRLLTGDGRTGAEYVPQKDGLLQIVGAVLFLLWFLIMAFYFWLIRRNTVQIDLIEKDSGTGEDRVKRKWFDVLLQGGILLTGAFLRWCYVLFILVPDSTTIK